MCAQMCGPLHMVCVYLHECCVGDMLECQELLSSSEMDICPWNEHVRVNIFMKSDSAGFSTFLEERKMSGVVEGHSCSKPDLWELISPQKTTLGLARAWAHSKLLSGPQHTFSLPLHTRFY